MRILLVLALLMMSVVILAQDDDGESYTVSPTPVTEYRGDFGRVIVGAGQIGVRYDATGSFSRTLSPGYHIFFSPYDVIVFTVDTLTYDSATIEARSVDGQELDIDLSVDYRLLAQAVDEVGLDYVENLLRPTIRQLTREVMAGYAAGDLYITTIDAAAELRVLLDVTLAEQFAIERVNIDDLRFSPAFTEALNARETAEFAITGAIATAESIRMTAEAEAEGRIQGAELTATAEAGSN